MSQDFGEPWELYQTPDSRYFILNKFAEQMNGESYARAVACVNALAGIADPAAFRKEAETNADWASVGFSAACRLASAGMKGLGLVEGVDQIIAERDKLFARIKELEDVLRSISAMKESTVHPETLFGRVLEKADSALEQEDPPRPYATAIRDGHTVPLIGVPVSEGQERCVKCGAVGNLGDMHLNQAGDMECAKCREGGE